MIIRCLGYISYIKIETNRACDLFAPLFKNYDVNTQADFKCAEWCNGPHLVRWKDSMFQTSTTDKTPLIKKKYIYI